MFQKAFKTASRPLVSYSINFFSYEDPRKHKEDPNDPEPADERNVKMNTPLMSFTAQV